MAVQIKNSMGETMFWLSIWRCLRDLCSLLPFSLHLSGGDKGLSSPSGLGWNAWSETG